jgi:hypothetical protein
MSGANPSKDVTEALARLEAVQRSPTSLTKYKKLLALNSELRRLRKLVCDRMNALPWNEEKKQLQDLLKRVDRALSNWEYRVEVDVSPKRQSELEKKLSVGGLNNSTRQKLQKELGTIKAYLRAMERARAKSAEELAALPSKFASEKIAEYKKLKALFLASKRPQT